MLNTNYQLRQSPQATFGMQTKTGHIILKAIAEQTKGSYTELDKILAPKNETPLGIAGKELLRQMTIATTKLKIPTYEHFAKRSLELGVADKFDRRDISLNTDLLLRHLPECGLEPNPSILSAIQGKPVRPQKLMN